MCICPDCDGTFFRSSICIPRGGPNLLKRHRSLVAMLDNAADRYGSTRRAGRASAVRAENQPDLSRVARQCASRGAAAAEPRRQARRSRVAHRRELAGLGVGVFRHRMRGRGCGSARSSDFCRGARADLRDCRADCCAAVERDGATPRGRDRGGRSLESSKSTSRSCRVHSSSKKGDHRRRPSPIARRSPRSSSPRVPLARPRA